MTETTNQTSDKAPPLTPMSLPMLLERIEHEWTTRKRIFDLPTARFWKPSPDVDLSFEFLGRPAASPVGPAAGPHSQMAQNIVLSWLGGSRLFELKTVQVLDDLDIARPCIDMQTIGYNIEWSQELLVHESLEEYVKAWMIIEMLKRWEPIQEFVGRNSDEVRALEPHVFDMSVGYDLAGIQTSEKVAGFIDAMRDATDGDRTTPCPRLPRTTSARVRSGLPRHRVPVTVISDTVTLSTFHGCPPDEIEQITKHLIDAHDLDVIVKLNPTLLGPGRRRPRIVHVTLGYDVRPARPAGLRGRPAVSTGRSRSFDELQPGSPSIAAIGSASSSPTRSSSTTTSTGCPIETMYLSGRAAARPRHRRARLARRPRLPGRLHDPRPRRPRRRPWRHDRRAGDIMVSFSAGVDQGEPRCGTIAMGVRPASVCSDLLKPGGYARLAPMLKALTAAVSDAGATDLDGFRSERLVAARAAGHRDTAAEHLAFVLGEGKAKYELAGNEKLPRSVDHDLEMWGCVACNFCVTVCPNDAFFKLPTPKPEADPAGLFAEVEGRQQYLVFSELCNECGNCLTFCPENGDPAVIKPRLYLDQTRFAAAEGPRFLIDIDGGITASASGGADAEIPRLLTVLTADEGLPLRADTPTAPIPGSA